MRSTDPFKPTNSAGDAVRESSRRAFLIDGAGIIAAGSLAGGLLTSRRTWARTADLTEPAPAQVDALRVLGRSSMRLPDSIPNPSIAVATDTLPQIEHVVVLMMENHSYDNFIGMLGRAPGQVSRGDGFTLGSDGFPTATNPYANGQLQRAFHMPTACQTDAHPSQEWQASHVQYDGGRNDGFVISASGPVSMGYWSQQDLPFTSDLATRFPIGTAGSAACSGRRIRIAAI